jgi:hypothetical protein
MASLLLLRENRPSPGKTLSVHTWKFWWGRIEAFLIGVGALTQAVWLSE